MKLFVFIVFRLDFFKSNLFVEFSDELALRNIVLSVFSFTIGQKFIEK